LGKSLCDDVDEGNDGFVEPLSPECTSFFL
jgi:hypothetical protein